MNEYILVGAVIGGTILALGGWGFATSILKGRDKRDD